MPQLFGSSIILVVILVVVLVGALLGLILLRRKKSGDAGAKARNAAAPQAAKSTRESRKATALAANAAAADAEQQAAIAAGPPPEFAAQTVSTPAGESAPLAVAPLPDSGAASAQPAPAAPSGGRFGHARAAEREVPVAPVFGSASVDPLQTIISSVLQGWGDVTAEDTNRLAVFRKEKVIAALASVELPKDFKTNEYAKTRLVQLKRYANSLERDGQPLGSPAIEHEFAGMSGGASAVAAAPAVAAAVIPTATPATPLVTPPSFPPATPTIPKAAVSCSGDTRRVDRRSLSCLRSAGRRHRTMESADQVGRRQGHD